MSKVQNTKDRQVINWPSSEAPDFGDWEAYAPEVVQKIVLGPSPGTDDADPLELDLSALAEWLPRFQRLTHLHLWKIQGLEVLPPLPPNLKCLDVRGCAELKVLPQLPDTLERLDLGNCSALKKLPSAPPKPLLERFFFDDCTGLKAGALETFLDDLAEAPLVEVDGSGSALSSLDEVPRKFLRKLVLAGCEKLVSVNGIETFSALEHLNLSGCSALEVLPNLPPKLHYLLLHGAKKLRGFMGQDISEIERGEEGENVARAFQSYQKFGRELVVMPGAKLLLLGDGNVGKTTLAKRLRWNSLNDKEKLEQPDLRPREGEPYTHRVEFGEWRTSLQLPTAIAEKLRKQAGDAGIKLNMNGAGELEGIIRIWDFGGQELYHATHRIFAREGSVFLLLWRQNPPPLRPMPEGMGRQLEQEEWKEWNRSRTLDYWLDYLRSLKSDRVSEVALVCTLCPSKATRSDWKNKAPRNRGMKDNAGNPLSSYYVESVKEDPEPVEELTQWIHAACAREAENIGLLKPRFFEDARGILRKLMASNRSERDPEKKVLLLAWQDWSRRLMENHHQVKPAGAPDLDEKDVETITTYLHRSGDIFQIASGGQKSVLVDQNRAAELIYEMLKPGAVLHRTVKETGGWFYGGVIEDSAEWKRLGATARERLVAYMQECRMIVKLADAEDSRLKQDIYLALDKWLLPPYPTEEQMKFCDSDLRELRQKVDRVMQSLTEPGTRMEARTKFVFGSQEITEFEFRNVFAILAGALGNEGTTYFRTVIQADDPWGEPGLLRVWWKPTDGIADSFTGTVEAVLVAPNRVILERMAMHLEGLLSKEGSPFRGLNQSRQRPAEEVDLSAAGIHGYSGSGRDFGISSSGVDAAKVQSMREAMVAEGVRALWYRDEKCRLGEARELRKYMMQLNNEPRMMLVISAGYLRGSLGDYHAPGFLQDDCETNWYCAYELADAVVRFANDTRSEEETMVVAIDSEQFRIGTFKDRANKLLRNMEAHFRAKYADRIKSGDEGKFSEYQEIYQKFSEAARDEVFNKFMQRFDSGAALWSYEDLARNDFAALKANLRARIPRLKRPGNAE